MKSKFTHEEKQAILDRYISKSESPTIIIKSLVLRAKAKRQSPERVTVFLTINYNFDTKLFNHHLFFQLIDLFYRQELGTYIP